MNRTTSRHVPAVLSVVIALLAAGCGGIGPANAGSGGTPGDEQAQRYAQCLQQHGIQASADGPNVQIGGGGQGPDQQQWQAAQAACKQFSPNGSGARPPASGQDLDRVAKYVQCMNQHGVPLQEKGGAVETGGNVDPAKMDQADKACQQVAGSGPIQAVPGPPRQ
jgi:hypothetical protein